MLYSWYYVGTDDGSDVHLTIQNEVQLQRVYNLCHIFHLQYNRLCKCCIISSSPFLCRRPGMWDIETPSPCPKIQEQVHSFVCHVYFFPTCNSKRHWLYFLANFTGMCTMSGGCAVYVHYCDIDDVKLQQTKTLFEFCMNFWNMWKIRPCRLTVSTFLLAKNNYINIGDVFFNVVMLSGW